MSSTSTIAFLSVPSPYQPYSVSQRSYNGQTLSFTRSSLIINHIPLSSSSSSASSSVVVEEEEEEEEEESPSPSPDGLATQDPDNAFPPTRGCKVCGRDVLEKGCNGEGRIQGGIATVPGFGWWPIKAYRPCPGFVASGGRYRRRGQSMDEVAFGRGEKD